MSEEYIVLAGRHIVVGTKCPECNKWNKTPITVIKADCEHCKKPFEKNISEEDKEVYDAEIVKDYLWIMIKTFQVKDKIIFHVNERNLSKATFLATLVKPMGIEMERTIKSSKNKATGKTMLVNEIIFRKSEDLKYYIEERVMKTK